MRILVVDDERKLAGQLRRGLCESGFAVDVALDGIDGRRLAVDGDYALILLDVMLPGVDGLAVLAELRKSRATPVLVLSARDSVDDKVRALEAGADDYLAKPFAFDELVARVKAVLRRGNKECSDPTVLMHGDLAVDLVRMKVVRAGRVLDLSAQEFSLLAALLRRAGEHVSRSALAAQVWDMAYDGSTNVVDVAIRRLRAKLDEPFPTKLLHTARGIGYVLETRDPVEQSQA